MTWTDLSSVFTYGSKLTSAQMQQLRDNLTALANGDSGAPSIQTSAIAASAVNSGQIGAGAVNESELGPGAVSASKVQTGIVQLPCYLQPNQSSGYVNGDTSWTDMTDASHRVYLPAGISSITAQLNVSRSGTEGGNSNYFRIRVGTDYSTSITTTSSAWAWGTVTLTTSATGWQDIVIQHYSQDTSPARSGYVHGFVACL